MANQRPNAFRDLHHRAGAFIIPNPWDVGSAKILAAMGFEALATTSAGYAFSRGRKDGGVATAEMLAHCREIVAATPLPVSADLEKGLGDTPEAAAQTIREAAAHRAWPAPRWRISPATRTSRSSISASRSSASRRQSKRPAGSATISSSRRGRRTSCTAAPISTTRSGGCKPSRRLAPMCSMRRASRSGPGPRGLRGGVQACQCAAPGGRSASPSWKRPGAKRLSVGSGLARLAYGSLIRRRQGDARARRHSHSRGTRPVSRTSKDISDCLGHPAWSLACPT